MKEGLEHGELCLEGGEVGGAKGGAMVGVGLAGLGSIGKGP